MNWISVDDRLPETKDAGGFNVSEIVLCAFFWEERWRYSVGVFGFWGDSSHWSWQFGGTGNPTHWAEIEPPNSKC